jgi:hypothetical protein
VNQLPVPTTWATDSQAITPIGPSAGEPSSQTPIGLYRYEISPTAASHSTLYPADPKSGGKYVESGKGDVHDCWHRGGGWFGGVYGLLMTRDREDHYLFSYDDANESIQLTDKRDAAMNWGGGFDVRVGHYFNCFQNGIEAVYWGVYPDTEASFTTADDVAGNLNGILNWDQLDYNGATADTFVNNAELHAIYQENEFHNVELNLLHFCGYCGGGPCNCSRLRYHWLAGIRYFRFSDDMRFGADTVDRVFTGAPEELFYDIDIDNNLIGFQVGAEGEYSLTPRLNIDLGLKLGLFGNYIEHSSVIHGAAGVAVINNGPNNGVEYAVDNSKDDVAMLGEVNLGVEYRITPAWSATVGYRAVAVTGVALPTDQIYPDLRGIQDVLLVDSNGSLILHGGYAGIEYQY